MNSSELYSILESSQKKRGYYFNRDEKHTLEILEGLLTNKQRYGYMACPCRLASSDYEKDKDIICPCEYRKEDVMEFGSCYCNLYVSQELNEEDLKKIVVPERRPVDKMDY